jgi:ornithine carbamoyltransferase
MFAGRDFLSMSDLTRSEILELVNLGIKLKSESRKGTLRHSLTGKVVGLLFEKPSTRTRASFETAAYQLGGQAMYMRPDELQLSRGEPVKDTARILGSYLNGLVIRTYGHQNLVEFAQYSPVPIVNALSDLEHPTQIIGDMMTIVETKGKLEGLKFVWIGDGNNVCNSWLLGGACTGMTVAVSCPKGCEPDESVIEKAKSLALQSGGKLDFVQDPQKAAIGADILYTDVWVSMGQERGSKRREQRFKGFQLNDKLVSKAKADCAVMHCLPAHRGHEITDQVLESARSIVWQQAENKLHGARVVLDAFLGIPYVAEGSVPSRHS